MGALINADMLISEYIAYLHSGITANSIGDYTELTYPFLDRYNDHLQIYIKPIGKDRFELSDDAYIINNLEMSGIKLTSNRKRIIEDVVHSYGINLKNDCLITTSSRRDLPQQQHLLLQCMLKLDDLYYLGRQNVKNAFQDDIRLFLEENNVGYTQAVYLLGKSGLPYKYDFLFQKNSRRPARFCVAHNKLEMGNTKMLLFDWQDIAKSRGDGELLVVYNGLLSQPENSLQILSEYEIETIDFEDKERFLHAVA